MAVLTHRTHLDTWGGHYGLHFSRPSGALHFWSVMTGPFWWATIWKNLSWGKQWIKKTLVKLSENVGEIHEMIRFNSFCVCDDSGSSRSWPATPTLWWWFLCMTRLEQMPYGSSSILVSMYAQILDSVHFSNMKLHFKKVTFLGYRIPSLSHQTPLLSRFFIAWYHILMLILHFPDSLQAWNSDWDVSQTCLFFRLLLQLLNTFGFFFSCSGFALFFILFFLFCLYSHKGLCVLLCARVSFQLKSPRWSVTKWRKHRCFWTTWHGKRLQACSRSSSWTPLTLPL